MNRCLAVCALALMGVLSACEATPNEPIGVTEQTLPPPAGAGATYVSNTLPGTWAPDERRVVTVTMNNSGTTTWTTATPSYVLSTLEGSSTWSWATTTVSGNVAPGANHTFSFVATAPSALVATPVSFSARMKTTTTDRFGATAGSFVQTIDPAATPAWGCTLTNDDIPTDMTPGEKRVVNLEFTNSGSQTWPASGMYVDSQDTPNTLWVASRNALPAGAVSPGGTVNVSFTITAPMALGPHAFTRELLDSNPGSIGRFRNRAPFCVSRTITVSNMGSPNYGSTVTSQTIPTLVTAGSNQIFSITMQNSGTTSWAGANFRLYSTNTPTSLWNITASPLGAMETIAATESRVFNLAVKAPAAAGTYSSSWRMHQTGGVGAFGATALTNNIVVTLCGNSTVNPGEQCDDGNLTNSDGCSNACQWEQDTIALDSDTPSRGLLGTVNNGQLAAVTIGDITGDGDPEVLVSQRTPSTGVTSAGSIFGFAGGSAFYTDSITTLPSNSVFEIAGATNSDLLGLVGGGRFITGEVSGDSIDDLIISAPQADGAGEMRTDSGEVFVIAGDPALLTAGLINLGAMTMPTQVTAHIFGAAAGHKLAVMASGDLTGDGVGDLLLGAPGESTNGASAGAMYVVTGPISGDIDLNTNPAGVFTILGTTAGDQLGNSAATIGDFGGSTNADILVGVPKAAPTALVSQGAAYGFFGPIAANSSLAGANVTWVGAVANANLGSSVAIGNVTGTAANEALIGGTQIKKAGTQFGGVVIWSGVVAGTYDMSAGATPTTIIYGGDIKDNCGSALALGLVDLDAYEDIVIGCGIADGPTNAGDRVGEIHVVLGAAALPGVYDFALRPSRFVIFGAATPDRLANYRQSLAVGDIDGDGRADICGGAYFAGGMSEPGTVYCIETTF